MTLKLSLRTGKASLLLVVGESHSTLLWCPKFSYIGKSDLGNFNNRSSSGLFDTLEDCCGANFWWDVDNCMAISPNDARFTFEFKLSDLKAPVSCQEADEIAAGWEHVIDSEYSELAYSNVTRIGCATIWKNPDTGMTECGGCLANLGYVGTTDAIFTEGVTQPESPWNEGLKLFLL